MNIKVCNLNILFEPTPKIPIPLNPLKGTLKSSLIFNEFPPAGGLRVKQLKINELGLFVVGSLVINMTCNLLYFSFLHVLFYSDYG
jgi:hypothetical protein